MSRASGNWKGWWITYRLRLLLLLGPNSMNFPADANPLTNALPSLFTPPSGFFQARTSFLKEVRLGFMSRLIWAMVRGLVRKSLGSRFLMTYHPKKDLTRRTRLRRRLSF